MEILKVCLTAALSAVALFLITKIIGHKQMAQLDFFDYITGITIGSVAAELATELEAPLNPLVAMLVYGVITVILTLLGGKFPKTRKFINGSPTIILDNGKLYRNNMKKAKMDLSEFMVMCRQEGFFNLNDIQTAVFEYNGHLTILPKATKRPLNPTDMNITPPLETIQTEVIMDGRILDENLKRLGVDIQWLQKALAAQGHRSPKDVFLCTCDNNKQLTVFLSN